MMTRSGWKRPWQRASEDPERGAASSTGVSIIAPEFVEGRNDDKERVAKDLRSLSSLCCHPRASEDPEWGAASSTGVSIIAPEFVEGRDDDNPEVMQPPRQASGSSLLAAFIGSVTPLLCAAQPAGVETQIVDALNKIFGTHPGFRANHAKGLIAEGRFKASPAALRLSKAAIFNGDSIPITVRFSDSTGLPNVPDGSPSANPHGIAIKFHPRDGSETDIVINSLTFFPVATGEDL